MSKDDLAEYIREQLEESKVVTADDLDGRPCTWCGDLIPFAEWERAVVWDVPEMGNKEYVHRYHYCSEACLDADREAGMMGDPNMHPESDSLVLGPEEREVLE